MTFFLHIYNFQHFWNYFTILIRSRPRPPEDEEMVALPYVKKRIKQNLKVDWNISETISIYDMIYHIWPLVRVKISKKNFAFFLTNVKTYLSKIHVSNSWKHSTFRESVLTTTLTKTQTGRGKIWKRQKWVVRNLIWFSLNFFWFFVRRSELCKSLNLIKPNSPLSHETEVRCEETDICLTWFHMRHSWGQFKSI